MCSHPFHLPVIIAIQPGVEAGLVGAEIEIGDADLIKAQRLAPGTYSIREIRKARFGLARVLPIIFVMRHDAALYRAEQVGELDRLAIAEHGIPGYTLMRRAGASVFRRLRTRWPEVRSLTVLCGGGNNGGDGYVVARLAREAGFEVQLFALVEPESLKGEAREAVRDWQALDEAEARKDDAIAGGLIVDALLGTGLDRAPEGLFAELIERANASKVPVVAVDIPSGLSADTGQALEPCIRADLTVSFIGRKRGLYTAMAGDRVGELAFDDLEVPPEVGAGIEPDAALLDASLIKEKLAPRLKATHKGHLGRVLIIGGEDGFSGAPILSGRAALRAGSGLVTLASRSRAASAALAVQPELMAHDVADVDALMELVAASDVVALGPGLGRSSWAQSLWRAAITADRPLVLDADGLYWLSREPVSRSDWILTPHPGEAARLLETSIKAIEADRFAAARALARQYRATVVLKGWGTLIATPDGEVSVCPFGGPAMATAGMGDALTGIIASFLGQGIELETAGRLGVVVHALAGDRAARGRRQILASDLIDQLASVLPA